MIECVDAQTSVKKTICQADSCNKYCLYASQVTHAIMHLQITLLRQKQYNCRTYSVLLLRESVDEDAPKFYTASFSILLGKISPQSHWLFNVVTESYTLIRNRLQHKINLTCQCCIESLYCPIIFTMDKMKLVEIPFKNVIIQSCVFTSRPLNNCP